jgi:hypothetical protein
MANRQPAKRFGRTQRPLAVLLLLMAFLSLLLPYLTVRLPEGLPIRGTKLITIWLPLFFITVSCICLLIGRKRSSATAACCSAIVTLFSLYLVYREIKVLDMVTKPFLKYGLLYKSTTVPGLGFLLLSGCSIVLLFVTLLAVRYSPPPRKPLEENELIDDPIDD